jgi:long-chain acyl-CoA synthetase
MPLESLLEERARRAPEKIALLAGGARFTYAEIERASNRLARGLGALGVAPGDRVVLCLENSYECVVSMFAVLKAGAVATLVSSSTKGEKLARLLDHAEASALIVAGRKLDTMPGMIEERSALRAVIFVGDAPAHAPATSWAHEVAGTSARPVPWARLAEDGDVTPPPKIHTDDDLALLLYTSGSTGAPKGVMHTHHGLMSVTASITTYLGSAADDVILQVLPLSFGYGLSQLLTTFAVGGTLVLERFFAFPPLTLARIAEERATGFAIVPTIAALIAQTDLSGHDLSSLRTITNAGAALPPDLARTLGQKLPHVRIIPMYGQTECIRASFLPPEELLRRPASVGRGIPGQDYWLVDEQGEPVAPGGRGELVVRGPHVMSGYWKMPEETAQKIRPGRHARERVLLTGDLFHMDADGWLTFIARKDDIIKTRGEKVSPKEVEETILGLEGVAEAAIVGAPDPILGEAIVAFVVPMPGMFLDERSVQRHCAARLEDFAVPRSVFVLEEMPKTPNGKIDKQALKNRIAMRGA